MNRDLNILRIDTFNTPDNLLSLNYNTHSLDIKNFPHMKMMIPNLKLRLCFQLILRW